MAKYKVWLTVKDSYGNIKEVDAGDIAVDFELGQEELVKIEESLPLKEYLKKTEIDKELNYYATDVEVAEATQNTVKYGEFIVKDEVGN
jgi:hypothetical protein